MNEIKANLPVYALIIACMTAFMLSIWDGKLTRDDAYLSLLILCGVLALWLGGYSWGYLREIWRGER